MASRESAGHPVAEALLDTIRKFALPTVLFENHLEARQFDLYDDPMPSLGDLEGYCGETSSSLFQLAALILGEGRDAGAADASGHAGVAYAITGLLRALPLTSARGQVYLPRDLLERHGASPEDVRARRGGAGLAAALRELCAAARGHLAKRRRGSPNCRKRSRPPMRRWRWSPRISQYWSARRRRRSAPSSRSRSGEGNGRFGAGRANISSGNTLAEHVEPSAPAAAAIFPWPPALPQAWQPASPRA